MFCARFGCLAFVVVFFTTSGLGKTIVPREAEAEAEPEKRPSGLETGRRRGPAFGQPGLGGSYPAPPPKDDLIRTSVPDNDFKEPSVEEDERNDVSARRIPDEGFFPGIGGIRDPIEGEEGSDQTDVNRSEIPEIDNDIGEIRDNEEGKNPEEVPDYSDEGNGKGGNLSEDGRDVQRTDENDERSKEDDVNNPEDVGSDKPSEDGKDGDGPDVVTGVNSDEEIASTSEGFIFDDTFFSFRQVSKYFQRLERALELFFRQTMDELPVLNGTYANTTEEDVDIGGHLYRVVKSLIKNWGKNNSVYIETLSPIPDSNGSQVLKGGKL